MLAEGLSGLADADTPVGALGNLAKLAISAMSPVTVNVMELPDPLLVPAPDRAPDHPVNP
jgi:hypothetical protein